jgi:integrase
MAKAETKGNKRKRTKSRASNGSGCLVLRGKTWTARWMVNGKLISRSLHTSDRATAETELARLSTPRTGLRDREAVWKLTRAISSRLDDVTEQVRTATIPITQLYDLWLASPVRGRASGRTLESYRHQISAFGDWLKTNYPEITSARDVSQVVAEEYVAHRRATRSSGTVAKDLNLLASVWRALSHRYGLEYNPWTAERIPRPASRPFARRALTDEECDALLNVASGEQKLQILFALDAGLRLGDVVTLRWSEIDTNLRIIRRDTRKTGSRVVPPLSNRLIEALEKRKAASADKEGYVFPDSVARLRDDGNTDNISREMTRLFKLAKISTQTTDEDGKNHTIASYHSLRHTFVSRLMERGVNPYYVQRAVGHSTMTMTAHYDHSAAEEIRRALDAK